MTRHWSQVLGLCLAGAVSLTGAHASAADIDADDETGACHIVGTLSVHDDKTSWSVIVSDLQGEGDDCYARLVIQRGQRADSEVRSFKTHGEGDTVSFDGTRLRDQTLGATLYVCVDRGQQGDDCTEVHHVDEQ